MCAGGRGTGITPLKGMAEYAADHRLTIPVRLLYANRSVDEIVYRDELAALESSNPNFRVLHTPTRETSASWHGRTGRIGVELLAETAQGLYDPVYYLCGAPIFIEDSFGNLVRSGIPERTFGLTCFADTGFTDANGGQRTLSESQLHMAGELRT
jgi:ferredoxin-NADP reductase